MRKYIDINRFKYCLLLLMFFMLTSFLSNASEKEIVARTDYKVNEEWQPKDVMGRDFWNVLGGTHLRKIWLKRLKEIIKLPMVKEAALSYRIKKLTAPKSPETLTTKALESLNIKKDRPAYIRIDFVRPPYRCIEEYSFDKKQYQTWKKNNPNATFFAGVEWDNEIIGGIIKNRGVKHLKRKKASEKLINKFKKEFPQPKNKKEAVNLMTKCREGVKRYVFNDPGNQMFLRSAWSFDHYALEGGADMAIMETTNTGPYRHQVSMFFARGACHQFDKKWAWYIALCYNGYDDKGKRANNMTPYYTTAFGKKIVGDVGDSDCALGHDFGVSTSLNMRDMYLAYLNGATAVQHEVWPYAYAQTINRQKDCKLSPHGEIVNEWFNFTKKNKRGIVYAPVALLIPYSQGYPAWGGNPWSALKEYKRGDHMIDAFMYTIIPFAQSTLNNLKNGNEGALSNSPYGDIYDVINPDTPKDPVSVKVLNYYKAAIMLGEYEANKKLAERLISYVKGGGTLLLNIKQINKFFPADFLGIKINPVLKSAKKTYIKGNISSLLNGKMYTLSRKYEFKKVTLKNAVPIIKDANNNVLACMNTYEKGHVIVTTVDYLTATKYSVNTGSLLKHLAAGKKFPLVTALLDNIVKEVLPLEVKGDIEYGLNKLKDGWLLYLINNKGVTKFTNKPQTVDMSKTANVKIFLKNIKSSKISELRKQKTISLNQKNNSFTIKIAPGDIKIVKIKTN